jgi:hypothetical protein
MQVLDALDLQSPILMDVWVRHLVLLLCVWGGAGVIVTIFVFRQNLIEIL